jgi:hypothetical protein
LKVYLAFVFVSANSELHPLEACMAFLLSHRCICSTLWQVIEVDIPGCVISDHIRPLMLLCPNVEKINMVQKEKGDTSVDLTWEDDLRLLQREYPRVQFEQHGVTFDYHRDF